MQFGADFFDPVVSSFARENTRGALLIGNHPFGSEMRVAQLRTALARLAHEDGTPSSLRDKLGEDGWPMLLEAILGIALNGSGMDALVFSMMRGDHLRANLQAIEHNRFASAEIALIRDYLLNSVELN
jgi:hypothetical protein